MNYASGHGSPYLRPLVAEIVRSRGAKTAVDIGTGVGHSGAFIKTLCDLDRLDGVEIHMGCIEQVPDGVYGTIWHASAEEFFPGGGYDVALCLDVMEHMRKPKALEMVGKFIAAGTDVVAVIPHDAVKKNGGEKEGNPQEAHISDWELSDFAGFSTVNYSDGEHLVVLVKAA